MWAARASHTCSTSCTNPLVPALLGGGQARDHSPATIVLFVHTRPISQVSQIASERTLSGADQGLQIQMQAAAGAALVVWLVATVVSTYKPRGLTQYGWRKQQERLQSQL